jgi:hypothetical protein
VFCRGVDGSSVLAPFSVLVVMSRWLQDFSRLIMCHVVEQTLAYSAVALSLIGSDRCLLCSPGHAD